MRIVFEFEPNMAKVLCLIAMFVVMLGVVHSHTYHSGSCPSVEPMPGFNMKQVISAYVFCLFFFSKLLEESGNLSNGLE